MIIVGSEVVALPNGSDADEWTPILRVPVPKLVAGGPEEAGGQEAHGKCVGGQVVAVERLGSRGIGGDVHTATILFRIRSRQICRTAISRYDRKDSTITEIRSRF